MATDVERLIVRLEATQAKFEKQLARANQTANRRARAIETRFGRMNKNLSAGAARLGGALAGAFAGAVSARAAQRLIDSSIKIQNALKIAGASGSELTRVYQRLFETAQQNAVPIEALAQLYGRAALSQSELKISTEELLGFTDKVAVALRITGKSAGESAGALLQLSQALGSGIVRGEEFNSILENALPIAQAAAAGLEQAGGSVAKLRKLVIDGKVSSEAFFRAFEAGAIILDQKVAAAELTVSQRFIRLQNVLIDVAGKLNASTDASGKAGNALDRLAEVVREVGDFFDQVANGPLGTFASALVTADDYARRLLVTLGKFSFADEVVGALKDFVAPGDAASSRVAAAFGDQTTSGKTSRLPKARKVKPVSLSEFPILDDGKSKKKKLNDFEREIRQIQERTSAIEVMTRAQASINPLIDDYGFALEKARAAADLELAARRAGLKITPELKSQITQLAEGYAAAAASSEKLAESQDLVRAHAEEMRDLGRDVMGGFISDLRNGASAADALNNALGRIADTMLDQVLDSVFQVKNAGGGGGFLSNLFGGGSSVSAGLFHNGGVAGSASSSRSVHPAVFAGAPRYHNGGIAGLAPNEVPAILQKGELVLPNMAALRQPTGAGSGMTVHIDARGAQRGVGEEIATALDAYDRGRLARLSRDLPNLKRRGG